MSPTVEPFANNNSTNGRFSIAARLLGRFIRAVDLFNRKRAAALAADLFLTPQRMARPDREREWMEEANHYDIVTSDGFTIRCSTQGEGDRGTVLLVHGWEGRASQMGAIARSLAEAGYRVVAVDLPAHGDSPGKRTNMLEAASVLGDVARRLGPLAGVVAHSFGCAATTVAVTRGLDAARLVYIAPASRFGIFTDYFAAMLGLPRRMSRGVQEEIEGRFGVTWESLQPDALAPDNLPLLVIHDEVDKEIPLAEGRRVAAVWPGASILVTRGLGHRRIVRAPAVMRAATEFIGGRVTDVEAVAV